jgi:type II secretory pathway component PulM
VIRTASLVLLLAAAAGWFGLVIPAHRQCDQARSEFAQARRERERLRTQVAAAERRSGHGPRDGAEASRALRRSFLEAAQGLPVSVARIAISGRGRTSVQGSVVVEGRLPDLLRVAERLAEPDRGVRIQRVGLSEPGRVAERPARIEIQGTDARSGS